MLPLPHIRIAFAVVILFILSAVSKAESSQEEIKWLMINWPPYMIDRGENHWEGYGVNFLKHIQLSLQGYKHTYIGTRSGGINEAFKQHKNVCSIGLFPTDDRSKIMTFSLPDQIFTPMRLWVRKETASTLKNSNKVSLRTLLSEGSLTLGLKDGIAYAEGIRRAIDGFEGQANVVRLNQKLMTAPLITMLANKRLDVVLEYSDMFQWVAANDPALSIEDFKGYDIEELASEVLFSRVACSKSTWGKAVIKKINKHLPNLYTMPSYWDDFYSFLSVSEINAIESLISKMKANTEAYMLD